MKELHKEKYRLLMLHNIFHLSLTGTETLTLTMIAVTSIRLEVSETMTNLGSDCMQKTSPFFSQQHKDIAHICSLIKTSLPCTTVKESHLYCTIVTLL